MNGCLMEGNKRKCFNKLLKQLFLTKNGSPSILHKHLTWVRGSMVNLKKQETITNGATNILNCRAQSNSLEFDTTPSTSPAP